MANEDGRSNVDSVEDVTKQDLPERRRQKIIDEEVKESEQFINSVTDVKILRELYKKDLRSNVRRRLLQEEEKLLYKSKYEASERDKLQITKEARVTEFILGFRSLPDQYEKSYFPVWLRENVSDHTTRWRIMFNIEDSDFVQILRSRLDKAIIKEDNFFRALNVFRAKSNFEHHEGDIPEITAEDEWKKIFSRLNIKDYSDKKCLQILSQAITKDENDMIWTKKNARKKTPAALFMKGLPFSYTEGDIKKFLIDEKKPDIISNIVILTEETKPNKMRSTGEAVVFLTSTTKALLIFGEKNGYQFSSSKLNINNPYSLE